MTPANTKLELVVRLQLSTLLELLRDVRAGKRGAVDLAESQIAYISGTLTDALDEAISATPEVGP